MGEYCKKLPTESRKNTKYAVAARMRSQYVVVFCRVSFSVEMRGRGIINIEYFNHSLIIHIVGL